MKKFSFILTVLLIAFASSSVFSMCSPTVTTSDAMCNSTNVVQGTCEVGSNAGGYTTCLFGGCANEQYQTYMQFTATSTAVIIDFTSTGIANADVALITNSADGCGGTDVNTCPAITGLCIESCNTSVGGGSVTVNPISLTIGETYIIMIESDPGDAGTFEICISTDLCRDGILNNGETAIDCGGPNCSPCAVVNDDCPGAIPMTLNATNAIGSGATNQCELGVDIVFCNDPGTEDCYTCGAGGCTVCFYMSCGSIENNTWYTFTPATTDSFYFALQNQTCTNGDGMQMWIGTLPSGCGDAETYNEIFCQSTATTADITTTLLLTAGVTYTITLDGWAGDDCSFDFGVYSTNPLLPVELVNFNGNYLPDDKNTLLSWVTSSEINNDYFTIEKSSDNMIYEVLGIVTGSGNSNTTKEYALPDQNPATGVTYYRLKQTDYDGITKNKGTVAVNVSDESDIKLYPTITKTNVNLEIFNAAPTYVNIVVYSVTGAIVFEEKIELGRGKTSYVIPSSDYDAGIYYVNVSSLNNSTKNTSLKFVKN